MKRGAFLAAALLVATPGGVSWAALDAYTPEIPTGAAPIVVALLVGVALLIRRRYRKAK